MSFTPFEHDLMRALLAGDHPELDALREQFASATVERRETSERGFAAILRVAGGPLVEEVAVIGDLQVQLEGAATPADALLHLADGRLYALECFVYDGVFPAEPKIVAAWYYGTEKFPAIGEELFATRDVEAALESE